MDKKESIRAALTLKNLKRHDSKIVEILNQSPFAVVYHSSQDDKGEHAWVKSNIEGPMFLFKRSQEPFYGFMILNHKGLEYVHELLTPQLDTVSEGGMIMFRASIDEDRATGIWVQDDEDRKWMFTRMEELRLAPSEEPDPVPQPTATSIAYNQSIPLDILFASSSLTEPMNPPPLPPPPNSTPAAPAGILLLDTLFKSAQSPTFAAPTLPFQRSDASVPPPMDARALLAMIGHPGGAEPVSSHPVPQKAASDVPVAITTTSQPLKQPLFAPPLLSHDLFNMPVLPKKKKEEPPMSPPAKVPLVEKVNKPVSKPTPTTKASPTKSNGAGPVELKTSKLPPKPLVKEILSPILDDAVAGTHLGMGGKGGSSVPGSAEPLDKSEFIRAVQEILKKPAFSTALYARYLSRFTDYQLALEEGVTEED